MTEDLAQEIERCKIQLCDAFSTLEFAYKNFDSTTSSSDLVSIMGTVVNSGMSAYERLDSALFKAGSNKAGA